jgi:hypothetical protein
MEETPHLHRIEDDLTDTWIEDWAGEGVKSIEEYLGKFAAFAVYYDEPNRPIEEIELEDPSEIMAERAA